MPPTTAKTVDGPLRRVPCAHCGKPNDLRDLKKDLESGGGSGSFESGTSYACDHCGLLNMITMVTEVIVVQVRQG